MCAWHHMRASMPVTGDAPGEALPQHLWSTCCSSWHFTPKRLPQLNGNAWSVQVLDVLYACPPPAATVAAPARALDLDAARLLHQLTDIRRQVDALWRSAQQRLAQAQDAATEASTPSGGVRTPDGSDALLGADSQLPTLLNVPFTPQSSGCDTHQFVADGIAVSTGLSDGLPAVQSSIEAGMYPSDVSLKSGWGAEESAEEARTGAEPLAPPRVGTCRRFTAFAASPSDTRGLQRRTLAASTGGLRGQGRGHTSRHTVAAVSQGGISLGHGRAAARSPGEEDSVLEAAATPGMPDAPVSPSRASPGQDRPSDKVLRRKQFKLRCTAPGLPAQPQNLLILASTAGSEPSLPAARSHSSCGELASEESTQSAGAAGSGTEPGAAGSMENVGEAEAGQHGPDAADTWHKPPRLREHTLRNKHALLLGQCLLQEVACAGQAVSSALSSVATLRACCAQGAPLPAEVETRLRSLWNSTAPARGTGHGGGRGTPKCRLELMPWLQARAVAGWVERVRNRVKCLQALVDGDWRTASWAAVYPDIAWPEALVAASERMFAATNQYVLAQVGSLAFVDASPEQLAQGEAHFVLPPSGVRPLLLHSEPGGAVSMSLCCWAVCLATVLERTPVWHHGELHGIGLRTARRGGQITNTTTSDQGAPASAAHYSFTITNACTHMGCHTSVWTRVSGDVASLVAAVQGALLRASMRDCTWLRRTCVRAAGEAGALHTRTPHTPWSCTADPHWSLEKGPARRLHRRCVMGETAGPV